MAIDGKMMDCATKMALLELINGGPEIGRLPDDHPFIQTLPKIKGKGKMILIGTGSSLEDKNSFKQMWEDDRTT